MKMTILSLLILLFSFNILLAQKTSTEVVQFGHDQYALTRQTQAQLDKIIQASKDKNIAQIKVSGHTDSDGADTYNTKLSFKRAKAVTDYLTTHGMNQQPIALDHLGETQPVASNKNDRGKQQNRRVEIQIVYEFIIPNSFDVGFQQHQVDPRSDTVIQLNAKGTTLRVPAHCFIDKNGKPISESVTLKFREFTNSAEMAFSKIPMTYKQGDEEYFFNSAGMFELTGMVNGQTVEIAKDKAIQIDYSLVQKQPDISFFKLKEKDGNWQKVQAIEQIVQKNEALVETRPVQMAKVWRKGIFMDKPVQFKDDGNREDATLLAAGADVGHTYPDIIKGLNISSFGVYNCDQIYRVPNRVIIQATYVDAEGKTIDDLHVLSMIDLKYNGAFSFNPSNFVCDAKGQNVLALFTQSGDLYLHDASDFAKMDIKGSGEYTFTMKNMSDKIKGTKDLANYLGIKM